MKKTPFHVSRRSFISQSSKATLALGIGSTMVGSSFLAACGSPGEKEQKITLSTGFEQTPLGYDYTSLEPNIDAMTMEIHYTKHAAAYAKNLGEAVSEEGVDASKPLEDVLMNISKYSTKMRNNGGGHYNHELYWKIMKPNAGGKPEGVLAEAINSSFGSFEAFVEQFETAGKTRFGSGWAWLVLDKSNKLAVGSTPNQDNPLMDVSEFQGIPLMGIDVWEHAYYLNYTSDRAGYISNWWNVINWDLVSERYEALV
ncbi:superoxide dismutase [Rhodonellum psychrophilum GCM71 = DSM 17998]|uniref:Superoxide dismutase n=2 Tax=Rhodonellum TaxID=336827 RepID=U5C1V6_9BACT|nr:MULTISPECIES: superoxide dismutase [Rhodonellum]ERM82891.1 superoxide dismutase [Rhodonellum psychrophilum GCM71 = DSM 17998]SDY47322.1 superoxide dismutase, Fe-Mn family [Rhodonellum ikkaensis]